jgi:hypothetical protein
MLKEKRQYGTKEFVLGMTAFIGIAVIAIFLPFFLGKSGVTYPQPTYWDNVVSSFDIGFYYLSAWIWGAIKIGCIILIAKGVQIAVDDIKRWKQSWIYTKSSDACKSIYNFFSKIGIKISKRFNDGRRDDRTPSDKE